MVNINTLRIFFSEQSKNKKHKHKEEKEIVVANDGHEGWFFCKLFLITLHKSFSKLEKKILKR